MTIGTMNDLERARLLELAVDRAVGVLALDEALELERLTGQYNVRLDDSFEQAAAALTLALQRPAEPLPEPLKTQILRSADRYFAPARAQVAGRASAATPAAAPATLARARRPVTGAFAGWALAAGLAVILVFRGPSAPDPESQPVAPAGARQAGTSSTEPTTAAADRPAPVSVSPDRGATPAQPAERAAAAGDDPVAARARLLANERFLMRRNWAPGADPTGIGVKGDVIWDEERQTGYMRFTGLRRNDPSFEQYQLWIFDGRRDARYPIDGGVFDAIGRGDEIVVPIRAKLPVGTPLMFAVTLERPGGVVVSDRSRIVVVARAS